MSLPSIPIGVVIVLAIVVITLMHRLGEAKKRNLKLTLRDDDYRSWKHIHDLDRQFAWKFSAFVGGVAALCWFFDWTTAAIILGFLANWGVIYYPDLHGS